jgi:hypothetical protein
MGPWPAQILSDAARHAVRSATTEAPKQAINTKRFKDQTGLLTSMIKGWVEISVPGGAIGEIGAYTYYASFVDERHQASRDSRQPDADVQDGGRSLGFGARGASPRHEANGFRRRPLPLGRGHHDS